MPGAVTVVPWEPSTLKPIFDQLIPSVESMTVKQITSRAAKAKLSKELVAEIEKDAQWAAPARKAIEVTAPRITAKWLNKTGVSAEHQDEIVFGTAIATITASHVMLLNKLDKMIEAQSVTPQESKAKEPAKAA